jgi:hypothetical protein
MLLFLSLLIILLSTLFFRNVYILIFSLLIIFIHYAILIYKYSAFLSLLLLLVYSGGIAVLFLFISFSIDSKDVVRTNLLNIGFLLLFCLLIKFIIPGYGLYKIQFLEQITNINYLKMPYDLLKFWEVMYNTQISILIVITAIILYIVMVGSIGTFNKRIKSFN